MISRASLHDILFSGTRHAKAARIVSRSIAVVVLVAVASAVLQTEPALAETWATVFTLSDIVIGALFVIEYALRIYSCVERPDYAGPWGRLRYALSPGALIDLAALAPFLLSIGAIEQGFLLRLLRLGRLIALAKLGRYSRAAEHLVRAVRRRRYELFLSLCVSFIVIIFAAAILYAAERNANPDHFGSIPRAMWWGVATITKVGYGGAFPVTILGRIAAAFLAVGAIGVVALPSGVLAAACAEAFKRDSGREKQDA